MIRLAAALGLLGLSLALIYWLTQFQPQSVFPAEGQVISVKGQVFGRSHMDVHAQELKAQSPIPNPFIVTTTQNSEATLEFGERLRLGPDSRLKMEKFGSRYRFSLDKGQLSRFNPQESSEFLVAGELAPPLQEVLTVISTEPLNTTTPIHESRNGETEEESDKSKSPQILRETLSLHQRFLEKCFIQHLEKHHGQSQSGEVRLQMSIEKSGRLSDISVAQSPYEDQEFHDCILEVVQRVRLKKEGLKTRHLEYPLIFRLP